MSQGHKRAWVGWLMAAIFFGGMALPARASSITFTFAGSVDATAFGLSAAEPFVLQTTYDPTQAPYPGSNADYLLPMTLNVGGFTVSENGLLQMAISPAADTFELGAAGYVTVGTYQETLTGLINGYDVWIGSLDFVNYVQPIDMLSSTSLPASADFLTQANIIGLDIENFDGTRKIVKDFGPDDYSATVTSPAPESGTGLLVLAGCLVLVGYRRAGRSSRQLQRHGVSDTI